MYEPQILSIPQKANAPPIELLRKTLLVPHQESRVPHFRVESQLVNQKSASTV